MHHGSTKSDGAAVTVFQAQKPSLVKQALHGNTGMPLNKLQIAHHHFVESKKLRHPFILQILASLDTDSSGAADEVPGAPLPSAGVYIIVTEACQPLTEWLRHKPTQDQLAWGLQCIVQALSFLHSSAQLAHGNLSPSSFYVTSSGDVKLFNFSLTTPIGVADGGGGPTHHFRNYEGIVTPNSYRSPERQQQQWQAVATSPLHCMDAFGLGILITEYYMGKVPPPLQKAVQRLQTPSLKMRPRVAPLLKCPVFDTPYSKLLTQLQELTIQPVEEKLRFWQSLDMAKVDPNVAQFKILPLLQTTITTICSSDSMLAQDLYRREVLSMMGPLFYIAENLLEDKEIAPHLTPLLQLLFNVKDRGVRGALLAKTPLLSSHLSKQDLNSLVFEPLCSGFADSSDALRELTLKATAVLVPYLYPPNVEKLSRYLVRLQSDSSPTIRAHSISMIPALSPHLSEVARQKLLLPAFSRAFKDPHAPSRLAALEATVACTEYFSLDEVATKVLPACMPLVLDGVGEVRTQAFIVIERFMDLLKAEHRKRSLGDVSGAVSTPTPTTLPMSKPAVSSSLASSLTQPTPTVAGSTTASSSSYLSGWYSSSSTSAPAPPAAPAAPTKPKAPAFSSLNIGGGTTTTSTAGTSNLGWDDDDDDLNFGEQEEEDVFAKIGIGSSGKSGGKLIMPGKSASSYKPEIKKLSMDNDLDGWDDF
jgi:SCY1-like protein 1